MTKAVKRIRLEAGTDLTRVLEDVQRDKTPCLIERNDEPIAVVVTVDDYDNLISVPKSRRFTGRLLELAGVWSDLDADQMTSDIRAAREAAPPSPPVEA